MKVKELIKQLQQLNQEAEVIIFTTDGVQEAAITGADTNDFSDNSDTKTIVLFYEEQ